VDAYFHLGRLLLNNSPDGADGIAAAQEAAKALERAVSLDPKAIPILIFIFEFPPLHQRRIFVWMRVCMTMASYA
jgi:hypothetical protein